MREIIFDTETTGLSVGEDRVVEIGAVEMVDLKLTGRHFHAYINPQKAMPEAARRIHGLDDKFLKKKPTFKRIVDKFLAFIGDDQLVAHNATFDLGMINGELERLEKPRLTNPVVDSLVLARKVRPGGRHTLDALLKYYGIAANRDLHGALLDSELLAEVYIELRGGRQGALGLKVVEDSTDDHVVLPTRPHPLPCRLTAQEIAAHEAFVAELGPDSIWSKYWTATVSDRAA